MRAAVLVLCAGLSLIATPGASDVIAVGVLAALALLVDRYALSRERPRLTCLVEALAAGLAVVATGGGTSPLLPYLVAPMLVIGLVGSWRQVAQTAAAATAGLVAGRAGALLLDADRDRSWAEFAALSGEWIGLGLAFGVVASWGRRLPQAGLDREDARYVEARELLEQLRGVTRRLPGGLDVSSAADALIDRCAQITPSARSAVLVQASSNGSLAPAAVRGTNRVPWRAPLTEPGPLQRAWDSRLPLVDRRPTDQTGRRVGSSLAVVPLVDGDLPFGLLILEAFDTEAFPPDVLAQLTAAAEDATLRLETALLFEEVRNNVSLEERGRLAREMHDGVAQELAFVGYQLDDLKFQAAKVDAGLVDQVTQVRTGLTRLISDIRVSITDLRSSVSSDRGLGAAISSYVRAVGSGQRTAVHVSLQESSFRLAGEAEVLLFQITQAVAQDVRKSGQADNLWVTLAVDPPSARLHVEHDGPIGDVAGLDLSTYAEQLSKISGQLQVKPRPGGGVTVEVLLQGGP